MALCRIIILSLVIMNSSKESAATCPKALIPYCRCLPMEGGMLLNITCKGNNVANISGELPDNTARFTYHACEPFVRLCDTNFTSTPNLLYLSINDCGDYKVLQRKIYPSAANDRMFEHLHELRELSIHINWEMQTVLPNLFVNLTNLRVLDLSNTRLINLDNLIASFEGLRQSVNLTVLNLWNIKTMEHSSPNLELQLDKLLEPLSNSTLEVLNLGYNAFRSITPGIIQFAPQLKRLVVRNNVLIPILTSSLMTEAFLHKTLEEVDFSEQGFRPVHDDSDWYTHGKDFRGYEWMDETTMMHQDKVFYTENEMHPRTVNYFNQDSNRKKQPNDDPMNPHTLKNPLKHYQKRQRQVSNTLKEVTWQEDIFRNQPNYEDTRDFIQHLFEEHIMSDHELQGVSENNANDGTVNEFVGNITTSEQSPISQYGNQSIIKEYIECFILLYQDTCNIIEPECNPLKQLLIDDHKLFCALLNFFFKWHFTGVHCAYIPPFNELIREDCGACFVIPLIGNLRRFSASNLNVYDKVLVFSDYRNEPLCFHSHSAIEYIDMSGTVPYGYPELSLYFHNEIRGFGNLTFLNVSRLGLDSLITNGNTSYPNLRILDASYNQITLSENKSLLQVAESMENLDLSYNQISQVAEDKFVELYYLKQLDLSNNFISKFSINLTDSKLLEYLGLANNRLTSLPESMIQQLNVIAQVNRSQPLRVNLAGNNLICTCATKPFMEWILHSHSKNLVFTDGENYTCSNRYSDKVALQKVTMYSINLECYEPIIYACAGAGGAVFLFLLGITYNRRWYLRHKWYLFTRDMTKRGYIHRQHEYAAYVCFNSNDEDDVCSWLDEDMKSQLNKFKIAYGHEAIAFGHDINHELEGLLNKCYRSILVLTPTFTANGNLMYEVNIIVDKLKDSGADSLIVIVRKPLRRLGLDPTLKLLMERHLCLEWVEDNTDAHNYFWERLKDAIGSPCRELYDRNDSRENPSGDADDQSALIQQP